MTQSSKRESAPITGALFLSVLGVVYGDIGTSPLYALRECFSGVHALALTREHVFASLSLLFWSLMIIVSIKYVLFILRAENNREGGILALYALANTSETVRRSSLAKWVLFLGLFGASLLYGDAMITPAISVLSAVEGLKLVTGHLDNYVVIITSAILIGLFFIQSQGTARIGILFGPIMLLWFSTLGALGIYGIAREPAVLAALSPTYAASFIIHEPRAAFFMLGAVFLAVTGGEALYADMGHFGRKPIQVAWFSLVFPALILNYFGQGAMLLADPAAIENPFFRLAPPVLLIPLVVLATCATIIASQAMISGVFSLTRQAIQLGYLPRTKVVHTSEDEIGQIYLPVVNWWLLVSTLLLVYFFRTSANLANAYGIAVSLTMVSTTLLAGTVVLGVWRWKKWLAILGIGFFLIVDVMFLAAQMAKLLHGGFLPLIIGILGCLCMFSWRRGRAVLSEKLYRTQTPLQEFVQKIRDEGIPRVPGTGVFLSTNSGATPAALAHTLKHNKTLLSRIIIMTMSTDNAPYVPSNERLKLKEYGDGFYMVTARLGFMEGPNVPRLLRAASKLIPDLDPGAVTFYLGRETLVSGRESVLPWWQARLFVLLSRNAENAASFFRLPSDRVIEVGMQVQI